LDDKDIVYSEYNSLRTIINETEKDPERWASILLIFSGTVFGLVFSRELNWPITAILSSIIIILIHIWRGMALKSLEKIINLRGAQSLCAREIFKLNNNKFKNIINVSINENYQYINERGILLITCLLHIMIICIFWYRFNLEFMEFISFPS
jgi:hypothetical protein